MRNESVSVGKVCDTVCPPASPPELQGERWVPKGPRVLSKEENKARRGEGRKPSQRPEGVLLP